MPRFGEREINKKKEKKKRDREKEKERERNLVGASEHERWFCVECDERYSNARRGRGCESEKDGAPRGTFHVRLCACGDDATLSYPEDGLVGEKDDERARATS